MAAAVPAPLPEGAPGRLPHHKDTQGPTQKAPLPLQRRPLLSIPPLILGVHGEEAQHHQVQEGPDDGQTHQDVDEAEGHVGRLLLQVPFLLQSHEIPKADGGEGDEAVVVSVEKAPFLKVGEGCGSNTERPNAGQEAHQDHVLHGHLGLPEAKALLGLVEEEADEGVHPLSQALEHDQSQRNAQNSVEHAEDFSCVCAWSGMTVT